ncbi:MAG TPA: lamin tail domain-containing protein, partial [Planctomycetota bacterium]|nr:lamin tail domain-containing protein [Planctomycetota bacterium]
MARPHVSILGLTVALLQGVLRGEEAWAPGESGILFSEIHYHPSADESANEFVELHNAGVRHVDVGGWTFTAGIELTMPRGIVIAPGDFLVVARNAAAIRAARKIENVVGDFKGSLKNSGSILELQTRSGRPAAWVHYRDGKGREGGLWPERPDGLGPSLEIVDPHPDGHRAWYWAPSRVPGGTPGVANSRWSGGAAESSAEGAGERWLALKINEARLEEPSAFVEIINKGPSTVKLDGLRLTTHPFGEGGVPLVGTIQRKKFFLVDKEPAARLASGGGRVLFLVESATREIIDALPLAGALLPAASSARWPDGSGNIVTSARATPGALNAAPPPS